MDSHKNTKVADYQLSCESGGSGKPSGQMPVSGCGTILVTSTLPRFNFTISSFNLMISLFNRSNSLRIHTGTYSPHSILSLYSDIFADYGYPGELISLNSTFLAGCRHLDDRGRWGDTKSVHFFLVKRCSLP